MALILAIILTIIIHNIYHRMFNITYFGLSAYFKELVGIFIFSLVICSAIFG